MKRELNEIEELKLDIQVKDNVIKFYKKWYENYENELLKEIEYYDIKLKEHNEFDSINAHYHMMYHLYRRMYEKFTGKAYRKENIKCVKN